MSSKLDKALSITLVLVTFPVWSFITLAFVIAFILDPRGPSEEG